MNIAIFNGFSFIHYEMIGFIVDYLNNFNYNYNIYAYDEECYEIDENILLIYNNDKIGNNWRKYYELIFNKKLNWFNPNTFNPDNYDLIFLLTDTDFVFKNEWKINYYYKIVCIFHDGNNINKNYFESLSVRYYYFNNNFNWILPCYKTINKKEKENILLNNKKINITCIGSVYGVLDMEEIFIKFFLNFNDIDFHIISRKINFKNYNSKNIYIYENCNTMLMYEILKKTNYIFCYYTIPEYNDIKLSAVIPLAFSFGCQLIIPSEWYRYYLFNSVIAYNNFNNFNLDKNINIDIIYNELNDLLEHRNNILNNIINKKRKIILNPELYLLNIFDRYNLNIPNIYFGIDNDIKNYFKINYLFDNNIKLNEINEPIFFNLNNINDYFNIINQRKYKDIIICENNDNNNINVINNNINKLKFIDIYHNKIIILFQK